MPKGKKRDFDLVEVEAVCQWLQSSGGRVTNATVAAEFQTSASCIGSKPEAVAVIDKYRSPRIQGWDSKKMQEARNRYTQSVQAAGLPVTIKVDPTLATWTPSQGRENERRSKEQDRHKYHNRYYAG